MTKKLLAHVAAMQGMSAAYIQPGGYTEQTGEKIASAAEYDYGAQAELFSGDMIYMLDGPEQRAAQAEAEAVASFIPDALRTCSPGFHGDKVSLSELIAALQAGVAAANRLDRMKKALFYGRDYIENDARPQASKPAPNEYATAVVAGVMPFTETNGVPYEQLFHAIIGNFTEAGEQLEAWLNAYLYGKDLDATNMREEFGDNLWYLAIGMNAVEKITGEPCDFETEMARVIKKLKTRFPDKFTEHAANNRDLAAERAVLEGSPEPVDNDEYTFDAEQVAAAQDIDPTQPGYDPGVSFRNAPATSQQEK